MASFSRSTSDKINIHILRQTHTPETACPSCHRHGRQYHQKMKSSQLLVSRLGRSTSDMRDAQGPSLYRPPSIFLESTHWKMVSRTAPPCPSLQPPPSPPRLLHNQLSVSIFGRNKVLACCWSCRRIMLFVSHLTTRSFTHGPEPIAHSFVSWALHPFLLSAD